MVAKLDAVLIHHHTHHPHRPILLPAMGLLGMADVLHRDGIRTQVVNLGVELRADPHFQLVRYLADVRASVVGLSVHWFFQLADSLALAGEIKRALPHVRVVMGGFSASLFAHEIVRDHPAVDVVVRGDGERPFLELCRHFLAGSQSVPPTVPNLVYRTTDGVQASPFSHVISEAELAELRSANLQLLKNRETFFRLGYYPTRRFRDRIDFQRAGLFVLHAGRGCPFSCVFCGGSRDAQCAMNNRAKQCSSRSTRSWRTSGKP